MARRATTLTDLNPPKDEQPESIEKTPSELRSDACEGILQIVQFGCMTFGLFSDAGAIGMFGPPMVEEAVKLADSNKVIAKKMDLLVEVGPYAGIVGAAIPFVAQILCNHGIVKAEMFANAGVVAPEQLEADMKTEMMRRAMAAMAKQKETEMEMERMRQEMMTATSSNGNGPEFTPPND